MQNATLSPGKGVGVGFGLSVHLMLEKGVRLISPFVFWLTHSERFLRKLFENPITAAPQNCWTRKPAEVVTEHKAGRTGPTDIHPSPHQQREPIS